MWLTRWHADTEAEIRECVDYMAAHNLNMLLIQVYGDAMALYQSSFVPRSTLVSGSFDNLETAIRLAHARGIEVHAWLNVVKVYAGGLGTPRDPNHIIRQHPDWAMVNSSGDSLINNVGKSGTTIFFCPGNAGFRRYCRDVAVEIASNYDVDGIHLDYIRYPGGEYCYCDTHRREFYAKYGRYPSPGDPDFDQWRFDDISKLVAGIYDDIQMVRPSCKLSAAVFRRSSSVFQDVQGWFEAGKLDIACPMLYTSDLTSFRDYVVKILDQCQPGGGESAHGVKAGVKIGQVVAGKDQRDRPQEHGNQPGNRGHGQALAPVQVSGGGKDLLE